MIKHLASLLFLLFAAAPAHAESASPIGLNIGSISDWSSNLPFIDIFKTSRPFTRTHPDLNVDEQGWVKSLGAGEHAQTYMLWDMKEQFPKGEYTVLYDGEGEIRYGSGAKKTGGAKGLDRIYVTPAKGGINLKIIKTNPSNYIRNIRVLLPGGVCKSNTTVRVDIASQCDDDTFLSFIDHHETLKFNPDFLRYLSDFSVLRFMDFMQTNSSLVTHWSDRTPANAATWARKSGSPIEIMVDLANRLKLDPWFTLPHRADDDYVRHFAQYVKDELNPDQKAYIEYTNEAWNGQFKQFGYMMEKGKEANIGSDKYDAGFKYYSRRSVEIFKIWGKVFGGTDRLVRVVGGQAANAYIHHVNLTFDDAYNYIDAIAIAPYIGGYLGDPKANTETLSTYALFKELRSKSLPESIDWIKAHAKLAKKHKVDLIAYEGGHHLTGILGAENNKKLNKLFDKADKNSQMKPLYERYLTEWKKAGGKLFTYYSAPSISTKWGRWGLSESLYEPRKKSPKYDAVLEFIENNPKWW